MNEFLNPKSMLTPGLAGSMCMAIANALWFSFDLPQRYSSLVLSYLFATVILAASIKPLWKRGLYYILNGLVIFSVAAGTNAAGLAASKAAEKNESGRVSVVAPSGAEQGSNMEPSSMALPTTLSQPAEKAMRELIATAKPGRYVMYKEDNSYLALKEQGEPTSYLVAPPERSPLAVQVTLIKRKPFFVPWF